MAIRLCFSFLIGFGSSLAIAATSPQRSPKTHIICSRTLRNIETQQEIADLNKAVQSNGDDRDSVLRLAKLQLENQNYSLAVIYYQRAVELGDSNSATLFNLASAYRGAGERMLAENTAALAKKASNRMPPVSIKKISLLIEARRLEESLVLIEELLAQEPTNQFGLRSKIRVLIPLGRLSEALAVAEELLRVTNVNDLFCRIEILRAYIANKQFIAAERLLPKKPIHLKEPSLVWLRARIEFGLGRREAAKSILLHLAQREKFKNKKTIIGLITVCAEGDPDLIAVKDHFSSPEWHIFKKTSQFREF